MGLPYSEFNDTLIPVAPLDGFGDQYPYGLGGGVYSGSGQPFCAGDGHGTWGINELTQVKGGDHI